jgi:ABC-type antimicrobial peptide transport system permease subunit
VALGASQADILRMVLRRGSTMLVIGMTLGLGAGLLLSRQRRNCCFRWRRMITVVIATLVVFISGAGCLSRRAAGIDLSPLAALRRD